MLCVLVIFIIAGGSYYWQTTRGEGETFKTTEEKDAYVRFEMEAYDSIKENYWKKLEDADLAQLFQLSQ